MECPKCHHENDEDARFCSQCGAELAAKPKDDEARGGLELPPVEGTAPVAGPTQSPAAEPVVVPPSVKPSGWSGPTSIVLVAVIAALLVVIAFLALFLARGSHRQGIPVEGKIASHTQSGRFARAEEEAAPGESRAAEREEGGPTDLEGGQGVPSDQPEARQEAVQPSPVPLHDPVAEASVVLENYLAADLGHDGAEMRKYLGGQALARFRPEVQGQEDVVVHSEKIVSHTVVDANTVRFSVEVKWSPEGGGETGTQTDRYVLKRTDAGWRITSTPAYPEGG